MREIAYTRVRYGYRRAHVLLRRKGWQLGVWRQLQTPLTTTKIAALCCYRG